MKTISDLQIDTGKSLIIFSCSYPEKNPENSIEEITYALTSVGVFQDIEGKK